MFCPFSIDFGMSSALGHAFAVVLPEHAKHFRKSCERNGPKAPFIFARPLTALDLQIANEKKKNAQVSRPYFDWLPVACSHGLHDPPHNL